MCDGVCLAAEMVEWRIKKRIETRYLDVMSRDIDQAIDMVAKAKAEGRRLSIGVLCNVIDLLERLIERNITPDLLTDQTSAHDPLNGYYPEGLVEEVADKMRKTEPGKYVEKSLDTMAHHVKLMIELQKRGAITFDYGNN